MHSHEYQFTPRELGRVLGPTLLAALALALALNVGALTRGLPAPRPVLDMDRTILIHQAESSRSAQTATSVFVGDSSCLMDLRSEALAQAGLDRFLNLATLSYLGLPTHGRLVRDYGLANTGRLETVVLLMHPESLRLTAAAGVYTDLLEAFWAQRDFYPERGWPGVVTRWLGTEIFQGRLMSRWSPAPLAGAFRRYYGFTWDLEREMTRQRGCAVDPHTYDPRSTRGSSEYRLAKRFEAESRQFRQCLPAGARLAVGLTPTPESFAGPDHAATCQAMLRQWSEWLRADWVLAELPATMADAQFASVTHLNEAGAREFSRKLAEALRRSGAWAGSR